MTLIETIILNNNYHTDGVCPTIYHPNCKEEVFSRATFHSRFMHDVGFEPTKLTQQILSLSPLTARETVRILNLPFCLMNICDYI